MSASSGTMEVDEEGTESTETPPAAHSPSVRPSDDAEAQSSSRAPKKACLVDVGSSSDALAVAGSSAVAVPRQERMLRKWGHIGR